MVRFNFITEDGAQSLTYDEYLKNDDLQAKIADKRRIFINLGLTLFSYDKHWLAGQPARKIRDVEQIMKEWKANPLKYFMPQGARSDIGKSAAAMFVNDMGHSVTGIISGNRYGKTTLMWVKMLLEIPIIPTDPDWPVFKDHGVQYREWTGPKQIGVGSYQLKNHMNTIWPQIVKAWTPVAELGDYAAKRHPNWTLNPYVPLTCGSELYMLAYEQKQDVFESQALDAMGWDEQGQEEKFVGSNERVATRRGYHFFSLTPHKVEGRPDTGAGSWIHKMTTGEETKGLSAKFYQGNLIRDMPDWIYPEKTKREKVFQWVTEPRQKRNRKKEREGRSRLYGEWHESSGLVYDDWERDIHVIPPRKIPLSWTSYRGLDHGRVNPCACVMGSINPDGDLFIHNEYYEIGKQIHQNVRGIVSVSGNKLVHDGHITNGGQRLRKMREVQSGRRYRKTALDARTFSRLSENGNMTLAKLYGACGLRVVQASGQNLENTIPIVAEWFAINEERKHVLTGEKGAPRIYIFSTCVHLIEEIEHYVNEYHKGRSKNASEKPRQKNDHAVDALRYLIMSKPIYVEGFGNVLEGDDDWDEKKTPRRPASCCPITGRIHR
jgi:hypothetical protein